MAYLTRRHARRTFLLEVAGLDTRFSTSANPAADSIAPAYMDGTGTDVPMTARACINSLSDWAWEVDPAGGICAYEPINVTLYTEGPLRRKANDPGHIFDRDGEQHAGWWATLITTIEAGTATPDIEVDTVAPGGWSYPRLIHIDGEAFVASAFGGTGTDVDPYTFTTTARAVGGTRQSAHTVGTTSANPTVTDEVVWWDGRPVRLMVAERYEIGHGPWIELFHGVLGSKPEIRGHKVALNLQPITTLLDVELGEPEENTPITLVHGWHQFRSPECCVVEHGQLVDIRAGLPVDEAYLVRAVLAEPGDGFVTYRWPGEVVEEVNAQWAADEDPPPLLGRLSVGGSELAVTFSRVDADEIGARVFFWSAKEILPGFTRPFETVSEVGAADTAWKLLALDLHRPESRDYPSREDGLLHVNRQRAPANRRGRVAEGEWIRGVDANTRLWTDGAPNQTHRIPCREIPLGFKGFGEQHMLVTRHLEVPDDGYVSVRINYYSLWRGEEAEAVIRIVDSEAVVLPEDAGTVYRWTIHGEDFTSIGDLWDLPGLPQVTITPAVVFRDRPPGRILLELVESGTGGGINGDHDVHGFGAGIRSGLVDERSFDQLQPEAGSEEWTEDVPSGSKLSKLATGLLQALGGVLALRTSPTDRRCRLTLIPLHAPSPTDALGSVANRDFLAKAPPEGHPDQRTVNRVKIEVTTTSGAVQPVVFRDNRSINRMSGETRTMEIDLRATRPISDEDAATEAYTRLRPVAGRVFLNMARPRTLWEGEVVSGPLLFAQPGGVYLFTSPRLRTPGTTAYGVTSEPARLLAARVGLMSAGAEISAVAHGIKVRGWGPSCEVTAEEDELDEDDLPTGNVILTVEDNLYSNMVGGLLDMDGFEVGDVIRLEPDGADDDAVQRTILAMDRTLRTFTVTGPSGMTTPHWGGIIPDAYDDAPAHHQGYAYLADADGLVGTGDVAGTTQV